jgi:transposase
MQDQETPKPSKEQERLIDAKISLLQLARELGNIQKACKVAGLARSSFYDIKRAYEQFGRNGLTQGHRGRKTQPIAPEIEERVLQFTRENPSMSYVRLTREIQLSGHGIGGRCLRGSGKNTALSANSTVTYG